MQPIGTSGVVGIQPEGAGRLQGQLEEAATSLRALSVRVQRLLDEAGVACAAPMEIREVAQWCGGQATDLARRRRLVVTPPQHSATSLPTTVGPAALVGPVPGQRTGGWFSWLGPLLRVDAGASTASLPGSPAPMSLGIRLPTGRGLPDGPAGGLPPGVPGLVMDAAAGSVPHGTRPSDAALPWLAGLTGVPVKKLSNGFHLIKHDAGLRPDDPTRIDSEGNVYSSDTGEHIGNVVDEAHG